MASYLVHSRCGYVGGLADVRNHGSEHTHQDQEEDEELVRNARIAEPQSIHQLETTQLVFQEIDDILAPGFRFDVNFFLNRDLDRDYVPDLERDYGDSLDFELDPHFDVDIQSDPEGAENDTKQARDRANWISWVLKASEKRRSANFELRWRPKNVMAAGRRHNKFEDTAIELARIPIAHASPKKPSDLRTAWTQGSFEIAVQLASKLIERLSSAPAQFDVDGTRELCAALRYRFIAYETMGLNTLAVVDAKRILDLIAKFGSDVDVEVDDNLLPVAAPQAPASISSTSESIDWDAYRGEKRLATDTLGGILVKRTKGGNQFLLRRTSKIAQLPVEIILLIADQLSSIDRISLANTRQDWRCIPELWRSLEFRRIKNTNAKGWNRDTIDACITAIETCQRRSRGILSCVVLKGLMTTHVVGRVLEALQPSSSSLKYLGIPTADQKQCYTQLYKRCRNLEGIDIRVYVDSNELGSSLTYDRASTLFPSAGKLGFKLKTFISSQNIDCGEIAPYMEGIEVIHGFRYSRQKQLNFIEAIARAAPTLIEWRDEAEEKWDFTTIVLGDYGAGPEQLPKKPIVFPKLVKLSGLWSEHFIDCEFPALEEARLNSLRGPSSLGHVANQHEQSRIATVVLRSPSLKKLDVLLPTGITAQDHIFSAIGDLKNLEELGLWSVGSLTLQKLVTLQKAVIDNQVPGKMILPGLHTLRLCSRLVPARQDRELERDLGEFLLLRFYLTQGCSLKEAKSRTEAALVGYDKACIGYTKAQKKKLMNGSAAAAASSLCYTGVFTTVDGNKRETFTAVLPKLIVTRGMSRNLMEGSLITQLVFATVEVDTTKQFEGYIGGHHGRAYY
ncbi:uncharacterized protein MEPE_04600 [Melanopsichium pennsylvanicum]|uniref:F-box domain-containing protein n=1 Tax=Melanopsichium pennsylvanicum TaxID=63383 RepID=A0AAJ5C6J1_9BASI|nr:uncharacterized protein MEPE_04600 [Melanopsichium pennsylvanicum]